MDPAEWATFRAANDALDRIEAAMAEVRQQVEQARTPQELRAARRRLDALIQDLQDL